jgi:hypothetical protein
VDRHYISGGKKWKKVQTMWSCICIIGESRWKRGGPAFQYKVEVGGFEVVRHFKLDGSRWKPGGPTFQNHVEVGGNKVVWHSNTRWK